MGPMEPVQAPKPERFGGSAGTSLSLSQPLGLTEVTVELMTQQVCRNTAWSRQPMARASQAPNYSQLELAPLELQQSASSRYLPRPSTTSRIPTPRRTLTNPIDVRIRLISDAPFLQFISTRFSIHPPPDTQATFRKRPHESERTETGQRRAKQQQQTQWQTGWSFPAYTVEDDGHGVDGTATRWEASSVPWAMLETARRSKRRDRNDKSETSRANISGPFVPPPSHLVGASSSACLSWWP